MSGLDKILEHITGEAKQQADEILSSSRRQADQILESGKKEAEDMAEAIRKQSQLDVAAAAERITSSADLKERRVILQAKLDEIEEVFESAKARLESMNDESYMELIGNMITRYASGQEGTILFNKKDIARLPEAVKDIIQQKHLKLSEEPADIRGGFILSYGDIEENCSFDVLIDTAREQLQDRIGQLLFEA